MKPSTQMFRALILLLAGGATCFAQRTYTASPIATSGYQSASLNWIGEDGKTGYGFGLVSGTFGTQCFTYFDGTSNPLLTSGAFCTGMAAAQGNFLVKLETDTNPGSANNVASFQLFVYKAGQYASLQQPDGVRLVSGSGLSGINANGQIATTLLCPAPPGIQSAYITTVPCAYAVSNTGVFTRLPDLG